jgi:hypothetical protein
VRGAGGLQPEDYGCFAEISVERVGTKREYKNNGILFRFSELFSYFCSVKAKRHENHRQEDLDPIC